MGIISDDNQRKGADISVANLSQIDAAQLQNIEKEKSSNIIRYGHLADDELFVSSDAATIELKFVNPSQ